MVHEGDAAHFHVTTETQINLHNTQKRTTVKKYHKTIITSCYQTFHRYYMCLNFEVDLHKVKSFEFGQVAT